MTPPTKSSNSKREQPPKLIRNAPLRRLRATKLINELLQPGMNITKVAKKMKLSTNTVRREIAYADKEGILEDAKEKLSNDLIPKALKIVSMHLDKVIEAAQDSEHPPPDLEAAMEILKGVHILAGTNRPSLFEEEKQITEVDSLEGYIQQRQLHAAKPESSPRIIDIEIQDEEESQNGEVLRGNDNERPNDQGSRSGQGKDSNDASETNL